MSEMIYALLLRLYPAQFRAAYGDEAMQLFHDRARDEQGMWAKLRLWMDLAADLATTLPRAHRQAAPGLLGFRRRASARLRDSTFSSPRFRA
jgi:hypothetical protein